MLFDMRRHGNAISGWVAPDNPGLVSKVRIVRPDGSTAELATNRTRPDVVEHGLRIGGFAPAYQPVTTAPLNFSVTNCLTSGEW